MKIAVIDGQGGGIGRHIVERLRRELPEEVEILALGTNAMATAAMLKAGANEGASGEAAIVYSASRVDVIVGPVSIVIPHSFLGELTPAMAAAVATSPAQKVLLPLWRGNITVVGWKQEPLPHLLEKMVQEIKEST
ncbi:MAG: hypothetical protein PWQ91_1448 [Eubacteriales bacterium]|nr:hypothetical protein [Eubacteriales bacterium]